MYERQEERHPASVRTLYAAVLRNYKQAEPNKGSNGYYLTGTGRVGGNLKCRWII